MIIAICDKCKNRVDKVEKTGKEYANYDLCQSCMEEANALIIDFKIARSKETDLLKVDKFFEWFGRPKIAAKKPWYKFW